MTIYPNMTLFIQIGIFLVLMFLLNSFLFKPMLRLLEERKARTVGRRERAADASAKADEIVADYEAKLAAARSEADKVRQELIKEGEAERARITKAASEEAEKTVAEIKAKLAGETESARAAVKADIEAMAAAMAEKIMGRAV